jgi:hypothetical protein
LLLVLFGDPGLPTLGRRTDCSPDPPDPGIPRRKAMPARHRKLEGRLRGGFVVVVVYFIKSFPFLFLLILMDTMSSQPALHITSAQRAQVSGAPSAGWGTVRVLFRLVLFLPP